MAAPQAPSRRPESPAGGGDQASAASFPRGWRRIAAAAGAGLAAYLLALGWTIPAGTALPATPAIIASQGTIWRGQLTLADGSVARWRWAPLRSIASLGFAVDWTLTGAGTDLAGRARIRPATTLIEGAAGSASAALLSGLFPNLPFACTMPLTVAIDRFRIGGGTVPFLGAVRSSAGLCAPAAGGSATAVPPLELTGRPAGEGSEVLLVPIGQRRRTLADGALGADGRLSLRVTAQGAETLPFASTPGGLRLETGF